MCASLCSCSLKGVHIKRIFLYNVFVFSQRIAFAGLRKMCYSGLSYTLKLLTYLSDANLENGCRTAWLGSTPRCTRSCTKGTLSREGFVSQVKFKFFLHFKGNLSRGLRFVFPTFLFPFLCKETPLFVVFCLITLRIPFSFLRSF